MATLAALVVIVGCQSNPERTSSARDRLTNLTPVRGRLSETLGTEVDMEWKADGALLVRWAIRSNEEGIAATVASDLLMIARVLHGSGLPIAFVQAEAVIEAVNYQQRIVRKVAVRATLPKTAIGGADWNVEFDNQLVGIRKIK